MTCAPVWRAPRTDMAWKGKAAMSWKMTLAVAVFASCAGLAQGASATTTYLSDNFNSDTQALNWPGDSVFTSVAVPQGNGQVSSTDLIGPGFYNYCQAGQGNCVDLDGSTGSGNYPAGELQSTSTFAAGNYGVAFTLSGNDRGAPAQTTDIYLGTTLVASITLDSSTPWKSYYYSTSTSGGNLTFVEEGPSDNQGNLLDNVSLTSVPEPATWAMMLVGFGALGAAARGRRGKVVASA